MTHPSQALDDVVHQRVRLGILAVLTEASYADFGYLKEVLGLTDGNLSRHLTVLEEAGHITIEKGFAGKRTKTTVKATDQGRQALDEHLTALKELIKRVEGD